MGHALPLPEAQEILTGNREIQGSPAATRTDTRFQPGRSGNPAGRPPGSRNRATLACEAALADRAMGVMEDVMAKAEAGHLGVARLVLARLLPARLGPGIELPAAATIDDLVAALDALAAATAAGEIAPAQANALTRILRLQLQALQAKAKEDEIAVDAPALLRALQRSHDAIATAAAASPAAARPPARPEHQPRPVPHLAPLSAARPAACGGLVPMAHWLNLNGLEQSLPAALAKGRAAPLKTAEETHGRPSR